MVKKKVIKIGILGGSFEPAHNGHLAISKIAIKKIRLSKIYWVVTKKNPFKKKHFFNLNKRFLLAKKIALKEKKIKVTYLDGITKSSRSINTIKYLFKKNKPNDLYFIIGSDILLELHRWRSWKRIVKLTKLIVFSRRGYDTKSKESIVSKYLNKKNIIFIKNKPINISSSYLRKNFKINN